MHGVVPRASPTPHLPRQLQYCLAKLQSTNNFLCMQLFLKLYSLVLKLSSPGMLPVLYPSNITLSSRIIMLHSEIHIDYNNINSHHYTCYP